MGEFISDHRTCCPQALTLVWLVRSYRCRIELMASTISTSRQFLLIAIIVCVAGHQALGLGRTQLAVHGTVRDSGGAAVKGAGVTLKAAAMTVHAVTNDEGHFEFENVTAR